MKLILSKFSNESGIGPVNLLELKSLKEKAEDYYDKNTIERWLSNPLDPTYRVFKLCISPIEAKIGPVIKQFLNSLSNKNKKPVTKILNLLRSSSYKTWKEWFQLTVSSCVSNLSDQEMSWLCSPSNQIFSCYINVSSIKRKSSSG